jgi:flagellar basal body-associated protein FliL
MHANNNVISEMQINAAKKIYEEEMTKKENQKKLIKILTIILAVIILVLIFFLVSYLYKKVVSMYPLHQPLVFLQIIRVHLWRYGFKNNGTDNAGSYCIV